MLKEGYASIVERNKGKKRTDWESLPPVPVLRKSIMNDFTPEILMRNRDANLRGVAVVVDEIMGLFNTINRYNIQIFFYLSVSTFSRASGYPPCYLAPLRRLQSRQSIWQLAAMVRPPSFQGVMWSASISLMSRTSSLRGQSGLAQCPPCLS